MGKGEAMDAEERSLDGPDPLTMQVAAQEMVHASASLTALEGQAPTGVGPALRASLPSDVQHSPPRC